MPFTLEKKVDLEDSNPRPNEETICFLHAYSRFGFRILARPGLPTKTLASKNFIAGTRLPLTIPDLSAPPDQDASGRRLLGDVSFLHLVQE